MLCVLLFSHVLYDWAILIAGISNEAIITERKKNILEVLRVSIHFEKAGDLGVLLMFVEYDYLDFSLFYRLTRPNCMFFIGLILERFCNIILMFTF